MEHMGDLLVNNLKNLNQSNFKNYILNLVPMTSDPTTTTIKQTKVIEMKKRAIPVILTKAETIELKEALEKDCHKFIETAVGTGGRIVPCRFFGKTETEAIVNNVNKICDADDMKRVIGGEAFKGQIEVLMRSIDNFVKHQHDCKLVNGGQSIQSGVLTKVTNTRSLASQKPTQVTRKKRCSPEEAKERKLEQEIRKRCRAEQQERRLVKKAVDDLRKENQCRIMEEVKAQYNLPNNG
jgi:hypothetical protein